MPKPLPKITEALIREWVGDTYAQRGRAYFHEGRVVNVKWRSGQLTGEVQGSSDEPYEVSISFEGKEVYGDCSCPMEYDCKHVAAVLYAAIQAPAPPSQTKRRNLDKLLTKLEKPALVTLVKAMLDAAPELGEVVEAHLATANIIALAQQAGEGGSLRHEVLGLLQKAEKPGQYRAAQRGLETLLEQAENLMKVKEWTAAAHIAQTVLDEMLLTGVTHHGGRYELADIQQTAAATLLACWGALSKADPVRRQALRTLFDFLAWDIHQGWRTGHTQKIEQGLAREVTSPEREQLLEWIAVASRQKARLTQAAYDDEEVYEEDFPNNTYGFGSPDAWKKLRARLTAKAPAPALPFADQPPRPLSQTRRKRGGQKRARGPAPRKASPARAKRAASSSGRKQSGRH